MDSRPDLRRRAANGLKAGERLTLSRTFSQADMERFGAISRDANPVHDDPAFVSLKGFERPICHGLLVGSLLTEIGGQIGWLATRLDFSFKRPVYPGDTITCELEIRSVDEKLFSQAEARFTNQNGAEVARARLEGFLPKAAERARLGELREG